MAVGRGTAVLGWAGQLAMQFSPRYTLVAALQLQGHGINASRLAAAIVSSECRWAFGLDLLPRRRLGFRSTRRVVRGRFANSAPFCGGAVVIGGRCFTRVADTIALWGFGLALARLLGRLFGG